MSNLRLRSLVCPDKSSLKDDTEHVVLSLPSTSTTKHKIEQQTSKNKKKNKKKKNLSKNQKLLRKRYESTRNSNAINEDEEDSSEKRDVKVKYSIVYFNWAVSDTEDDEDEDGPITNVTLPLNNLKLSS